MKELKKIINLLQKRFCKELIRDTWESGFSECSIFLSKEIKSLKEELSKSEELFLNLQENYTKIADSRLRVIKENSDLKKKLKKKTKKEEKEDNNYREALKIKYEQCVSERLMMVETKELENKLKIQNLQYENINLINQIKKLLKWRQM